MKKALYVLFFFLILRSSVLYAEMRIEITRGIDSAYPISIIPFQWIGFDASPLEDIGSIVAADLRNSGKFILLNRSDLFQIAENLQKKAQEKMCLSSGTDVFVIGRVSLNSDGSYDVSYQLVSASKNLKTVLAKNSYKITKKWLRYAAHAISNEIFEKLTGIKGAFCTRIAYIAHADDSHFPYELRVSDYDGYNQFVVHRSFQPLMSPTWSPKGDKLAYVSFNKKGRSSLVIRSLADGVIRQIASFPRHNGAPAFSPDGKKLAFALSKTGSLNLYVMDIESGKIHQITDSHSNNTEPSWFPDNKNLAYTSDQEILPQIYKVNIYEGIPERITWEGMQNQNASVSSDGKFMVMVSSNNGKQYITKQDLLTGSVQILSSSFLDETPTLAPNDTMVIYSSSQETGSVLNIVSVDGRSKTCITETGDRAKFPSWSPYL